MGRTIIYAEAMLQKCPNCGEIKPYYNNRQVYCRECAVERSKNSRIDSRRRKRKEQRGKPDKDVLKNKFTAKKNLKMPKRSIEEVVRIAMVNGISYGKAVWLLEGR